MKRLPDRPNIGHLKKQAKDLLALYREGDASAFARFRAALPIAANADNRTIASLDLRLHDAQSCVAREHGFASWAELKSFVAAREAQSSDPAATALTLMRLIYAGDIAGGMNRARPAVAARLLEASPEIAGKDPYLACAVGDVAALREELRRDAAWKDRPGGALGLPPLVAVTHSSLLRLPAYRERLMAAARLLLDAGADPGQSVQSRWAASPKAPSKEYPLSALYGAAGQNRDPELTQLLLERGANPNDGESLYHALESPACTRLLLKAGARVTGTNALYRALDLDDAEPLRLLLAHGGDPNERPPGAPTSAWGSPLLWAIRRRRSAEHVRALLAAGADPSARTPEGNSAYVLALKFGLPHVAELVREAGGSVSGLSEQEEFVAACTRGDEPAARRLLAERPGSLAALSASELRLLPELAAQDAGETVRLMVRLGWPVATRGGDWDASALNHAVFRGDSRLARFLLDHGASWREQHGFGDNVCGTLSWASCNEPVEGGDWPGCAEALVAHGLPAAHPGPQGSGVVVMEGTSRRFSEDVADVLLAAVPQVAPEGGGG
ncbi:ankyrin repeat domain-containing protein [Hyphomicrobium zavarzinii]|uniref:ankyrin repeat domain-containing protein n=1 Tax=Hyphomicrobium zavarzinii TaxID=48292 RepID=UPI00037D15B7|nr:ankyrin repeat domain-containing protein [Hyphomicrobium zavarzinii]